MKKGLFITLIIAIGALCANAEPNQYTSSKGFTWGVDAGGSIDLTSNDMSTIDFGLNLGYRNAWIDLVGVGAEANIMVNRSTSAFPIYGIIRTNFRPTPSVCFMDFRLGTVINSRPITGSEADIYVAPGVGINMATGSKFRSYMIISYQYNGLQDLRANGHQRHISGLHYASIKIGINF